jgi:hypothetical protein
MIVKCKACREKFKADEYRRGIVKYCSKRCHSLGAKKLVKNNCLKCRRVFSIIPSLAKKRKYCSKECSDKAKKGVGFSSEHKKNLIVHLRKFWGKSDRCVDCGRFYLKSHICIGKKKLRENVMKLFNNKNMRKLNLLKRIERIKNGEIQYSFGEEHHNWKGDDVKYVGLHKWVRIYKPKLKVCELCKTKKKLDLANKNGVYNRNFKNWFWLCRSCHIKYDRC